MPVTVQNGPNRWGFLGLTLHPPESHWEEGTEKHNGWDDLTYGSSQPPSLAAPKLAAGHEYIGCGGRDGGFELCMKGQRGRHVTKADGAMVTPEGKEGQQLIWSHFSVSHWSFGGR